MIKNCCLTLLILIVITITINCGQFHISRKVSNYIFGSNVTQLVALTDQRLAVISDKNDKWDVTIYQGPSYTSYNNYFTIPKTNRIIIYGDEIIIGDETQLVTK